MASNTLRFHRISRSDFNSNTTRTYNRGDLYFIFEASGNEGVIYMCKTAGTKSTAVFEQYSVVSFQSLTMTGAGKTVTYNPEDASAKSIDIANGDNVTIADNGSTTNTLKLKISSTNTKNTAGATNSTSKLFLVGATAQDANPQTYSNSAVFATGGVLSSNGIRLNASQSGSYPIEIYSVGDLDRFVKFGHDGTTDNAGASWSLGMLGSGSSDTNYFVIRSGTSATGATSWTNAVRIGQNTFDTGFAGHVYPQANGTKNLGTSSLKWNVVYGNKWNTSTVGSSTQPVYLKDGVFTACSSYTDTKNTAGSTNSTSKLFLIGAESQAANPQTYSNSSVYEQGGVLYSGGLLPVTDNSGNLGDNTHHWNEIHGKMIHLSNESGSPDGGAIYFGDCIDTSEDERFYNCYISEEADDYLNIHSFSGLNMETESCQINMQEVAGEMYNDGIIDISANTIGIGGVRLNLSYNNSYIEKFDQGDTTIKHIDLFNIPDTKNTAGSTNNNAKLYLIGTRVQDANPQTYSNVNIYASNGTLTTQSVQVGGGSATMQYDSTNECIRFVFA